MVQPPPFASPKSSVAFKVFLATVGFLVLLGLLFGCFGIGYQVGCHVTVGDYEDRIAAIQNASRDTEHKLLLRLRDSVDERLELLSTIEQMRAESDAERERYQAQVDHLLKPRPSFRAIEPLYPTTPNQ